MKVGIISLVSAIHDQDSIMDQSRSLIEALEDSLEIKKIEVSQIDTVDLPVVFICTGGTESLFKKIYPQLEETGKPVTLLSTNYHNSLPASMEILYWLKRRGLTDSILLHGPVEDIVAKIKSRARIVGIKEALKKKKAGVIGQPSDWLIASDVDYQKVRERWGVTFEDIPLQKLLDSRDSFSMQDINLAMIDFADASFKKEISAADMQEAVRIFLALEKIVRESGLSAFTLRCFDLLSALKNTGCLALSRLNDQGIPSGCEGDIPSLFTMMVSQLLTGEPSFMANPSQVHPDGVMFAHCTVPTRMVASYGYKTHFESGLGVAIAGTFENSPVTVSKINGPGLDEIFAADGEIIASPSQENLCRTQIKIKFNDGNDYFLKNPLGNHHIITKGEHSAMLKALFDF